MSTQRLAVEEEVPAAYDRFYGSGDEMANGDADALGDVWSHTDDVMTITPSAVGRRAGTP